METLTEINAKLPSADEAEQQFRKKYAPKDTWAGQASNVPSLDIFLKIARMLMQNKTEICAADFLMNLKFCGDSLSAETILGLFNSYASVMEQAGFLAPVPTVYDDFKLFKVLRKYNKSISYEDVQQSSL